MVDALRVLVDARMLIGRFSGVARMVTRLVDHLACMPNLRVVALCGNRPYEPWTDRNDLEMIVSDFTRKHRSPARRLLWEATRLRHWIARSGADVFHATWNTGVPFRCHVPSVLTIHDVIPWDDPVRGLSTRAARACYQYSLCASVRRAHRVVTVSGFTADQITRTTRHDPDRIRVIYNGVDQATGFDCSGTRSTNPYLLYVGGHEPRKNVQAVLGAAEQYWRLHDPAMEIHLTGAAEDLSESANQVYQRLGRDGRIRFLGTPSDEKLATEYAGATALLMLSRAEGFGLPVIEAMAHGCPVIAARCGALPEIVGNAGILVDPDDFGAIGDSIHRIVNTPGHAKALIAGGRERAEHFTWQRAAEAYQREYHLAVEAGRVPDRQSPAVQDWSLRTAGTFR